MVDCFTDWPPIHLMRSNTTSYAVISALRDYFARTAVPDVLWSAGHDMEWKTIFPYSILAIFFHSISILYQQPSIPYSIPY